MRLIRISPQARQDLGEIEEYISRDNPDAARRLMQTIRDKCVILSQQPAIGRDRSDLIPSLRSFAIGNYVVFYIPVQTGIEVVRVLHGARDIGELF